MIAESDNIDKASRLNRVVQGGHKYDIDNLETSNPHATIEVERDSPKVIDKIFDPFFLHEKICLW